MKAVSKRIADWLEKFSVAALAVAVFQNQPIGLAICVICLGASLYMTWRLER